MQNTPTNILFISWDDPKSKYLEGLFVPIFKALSAHGFQFHVLQFSWGHPTRLAEIARRCKEAGVSYRSVKIRRVLGAVGPFATALLGSRHIRRALRDWKIDILMPRSHMPALAVLRLGRSRLKMVKVIFDADGLAADERVDFSNLSPHGLTYRLLRDIEAEMLRCSDAVLARTDAALITLKARAGSVQSAPSYHVVSNGVDPTRFVDAVNDRVRLPSESAKRQTVFCYSGSLGEKYRTGELIELFCTIKSQMPDAIFRVFTPSGEMIFAELAGKDLQSSDWIIVQSLEQSDVAAALAQCDIGIGIFKKTFSTTAVVPVKLGEYLLAGLPVIGTPGIGNTTELESRGVFRSAEPEDIQTTIDWIRGEILPNRAKYRQMCHQHGVLRYSTAGAVSSYREALDALGAKQTVR